MTTYSLQPKDSDLDAIAALVTTTFGRSLLAAADLGALRAILGPTGTPSGSTYLRGDGTWATPATGSSGAVDSVNGQSGTVILTASDVGADASGAAAAAQAASQPVDSDLTAIAALTTTSYGRAFLALADATAARGALGLGTAATAASTSFDAAGAAAAAQAASQPLDSDLTAIAAVATTSFGRSFLALADAAAARTAIGAQQSDTELTALAGTTSAADKGIYYTGSGTASTYDLGTFARGLLALTTASSVRDYLGLTIGTNVQAFDSDLAAIAALTTTSYGRSFLPLADAAAARTLLGLGTAATADTGTTSGTIPLLSTGGLVPVARLGTGTPDGTKFLRDDGTFAVPPGSSGANIATDTIFDAKGDIVAGTGADTAAKVTVGANDTILIADSTQTAGVRWGTPTSVRTALGLVIGTNVQAWSAKLDALAAQTWAADTLTYQTSTSVLSTTTLTTFGRSLIDDADAATSRTTLGLVIGTDVQAFNSGLASIAALTTTSYGRSILTNVDAAATRTYLGLGSLATLSSVTESQVTNLVTDLAAKADASATTTALAAKAPIASPTFTGVPAAPTAVSGTNTTQVATTAYVQTEISATTTRKYSVDVGDGTNVALAVTHSLGTKDVDVQVRRNSDDGVVSVPYTMTSTSVVTLNFGIPPTSSQYRVTVHG